jgi:hypothetical protein
MAMRIVIAALVAFAGLVVGEATDASGMYPGYRNFSRRVSPRYYVAPRRSAEYSKPHAYYESSDYNNPRVRLRYGYGGYFGNFYRDRQGGFQLRYDSRYSFGIHR